MNLFFYWIFRLHCYLEKCAIQCECLDLCRSYLFLVILLHFFYINFIFYRRKQGYYCSLFILFILNFWSKRYLLLSNYHSKKILAHWLLFVNCLSNPMAILVVVPTYLLIFYCFFLVNILANEVSKVCVFHYFIMLWNFLLQQIACCCN